MNLQVWIERPMTGGIYVVIDGDGFTLRLQCNNEDDAIVLRDTIIERTI